MFTDPVFLIIWFVYFIWLAILTFVLVKAYLLYKTITVGISKKDFATALADLKKHSTTLDTNVQSLEKALASINTRLETHIQKLGFVRYNPFGDTGGDQSFCLCLLDELGNGILITSLHTRQQTRIYTKEIKAGKPSEDTPLSKEEAACIKKAQRWS